MSELHVVALSGGKDSTAMALRLAEVEPREYLYVCTPTGNELPEMFAHWRKLIGLLGAPIMPIVATTLGGLIEKQNALPNWRQRWCTKYLKIHPFAQFLARQVASGRTVISYVGLRADEEEREGGDYTRIPDATMRFPLREWGWGLSDVVGYLAEKQVTIPARTDCAVCFFQRLGEWYDLWINHPDAYAQGEAWAASTGFTFRSPGRDTWPAGLKELREAFEGGRIPRGVVVGDKIADMKCRVCRL